MRVTVTGGGKQPALKVPMQLRSAACERPDHGWWLMRLLLSAAACVLLLGGVLVADEGMWLFNAFPAAKVKATYGFVPTQAWLDHVRLSSVKFSNGSGSFVSA